ncbi:TldE/PmbA protein, part of proposed TldE/TldD proteolytic complex [Thioalkalivibrio nitratireducens DSM 14787]|uniref:TldE/PmbA protein, part of proposed TldE/TldD proteolytic complex n=1 Tax=Thioalkalivibrio nitratireducens (strain DSM 14787 / UNIQEM 213 / ALEN2) TaxID=1255043 RepID=L0DZL5_THIND|nr:metalloprotease PmbA [Thioalkalivibrio nitratireducens]AGA35039.1 TldE/PmbA protein, part of proposed TldE/TldD proteolytic complex [Thioalkalivibrio nitratireducens DSM 14787]
MDRTNEIQALSHTPESLQERVARVLEHTRACGASAAQVVVSHNVGLSVTVRRGEVETLEHERDQQMALVAYFGQSRGAASTTDFSPAALQQTAEAACRIARHTEPDPWAGLPDADTQARDWPELELDHPWDCPSDQAIELARRTEAAGFALDPRVDNSEGASVGTRRAMFWLGDTQGFMGGYCSTRHTLSCALVARDAGGMQRDYEYSVARDAVHLAEAEAIGRAAAERALRRLGARKLGTRQCPVLFMPEMARSLIGSFTRAIGGSAQYRRSSFLLDAAGQAVFPDWMQIDELPLLPGALGSAPFDGEGVRTRERALIAGGVLEGYILDSYSARRLGLQTTGNAGGARNVTVRPHPGDRGFTDLLADMGTGLLVTELIGQGVNAVTGDYSRGAAGFWVENGAIAYPVEEITIAGNLRDMYRRIAAVGNDTDLRGNTRTGSVLIESMTVAGD